MDLLAPETDLVAKLKDFLGVTVQVEAFPDNPETYDYTQPNGAVLVQYHGSVYAAPVPNRTGKVIQERTGNWICTILHRNLSQHGGVYALIEGVRRALTGYTLSGMPESTVLYPVNDGFINRNPGKWVYQITFAQSSPEVEG